MNRNLKPTFIIFVVLLIIILLTTFYLKNKALYQYSEIINKPSPIPSLLKEEPLDDNNVRCTADVKQCPDGSYVGRISPSCSFVPCPKNN